MMRMVRARPVVVPTVIVHINQVRVPFKTASAPAPGVVIAADPDACAVAQSRVAVGINVVDHMRVVYGNVHVFLLYGLDDDRLFLDDLDLLVTL